MFSFIIFKNKAVMATLKIIDVIPEISYRGSISLDRFQIKLVPVCSKQGNFGNDVF